MSKRAGFLSGNIEQLSQLFVVFIIVFVCVFSVSGCSLLPREEPKFESSYAISSAHPLATKAGMDVLAEGGNAFDAAVTVAAVLAVVEPFGSGLGGGGFWLLHDADQNKSIFIDGREKAPLSAVDTLYEDDQGEVNRELATDHPLAAAIPGTPAALVHVQKKYGTMSLSRLLQPAIVHARQGFAVTSEYQDALNMRLSSMQKWPDSSVFLQNGLLPQKGWVLRQPDLARTLELLAKAGHQGFYQGNVARNIVNAVRNNGGIWTLNDLQQYEIVEREPVSFTFGDALVTSAPLPSSGGLVMGLIFGQLEQLGYFQADALNQRHLFVEAMRNAYYLRALSMGDSDFTGDDGRSLLKDDLIRSYASKIQTDIAGDSSSMSAVTDGTSGDQTTHFSVLDAEGNRAAVTLSINLYFGSGFVAGDTGVLLNNEMDDFSAKPGAPNAYGLVGSTANKIEGGKRPLSSMSPTFVETPEYIYILGTPGGSRIISMVSGAMLHLISDSDASVADIVSQGRIHHQYLPDKLFFEPGALSAKEQRLLQAKGHHLQQVSSRYGDMQMIRWSKRTGEIRAAADPRGEGVATVQNLAKQGVK